MALTFRNYVLSSIEGGLDPQPAMLLAGKSGGTIVKSLEIITGDESCKVEVIRTDSTSTSFSADAVYADIKLDLKANDYLVLWEGFFVIPQNHRIWIKSTSSKVRVVANVVDMT